MDIRYDTYPHQPGFILFRLKIIKVRKFLQASFSGMLQKKLPEICLDAKQIVILFSY
jgi:hypothetical protein